MNSNSVQAVLPVVAALPESATAPVNVGTGVGGFLVQFVHVTGVADVQYVVEGSLDGQTWVDVTNDLRDIGHSDVAPTNVITADSIYDYPTRFPGSVRVRCAVAPGAPPEPAPTVTIAFQDARA